MTTGIALVNRKRREASILPFRLRKELIEEDSDNVLDAARSSNAFNESWWITQIMQIRPWAVLYSPTDLSAATQMAADAMELTSNPGPICYCTVMHDGTKAAGCALLGITEDQAAGLVIDYQGISLTPQGRREEGMLSQMTKIDLGYGEDYTFAIYTKDRKYLKFKMEFKELD